MLKSAVLRPLYVLGHKLAGGVNSGQLVLGRLHWTVDVPDLRLVVSPVVSPVRLYVLKCGVCLSHWPCSGSNWTIRRRRDSTIYS